MRASAARSSSCTRASNVSNDGGSSRREAELCAKGVIPIGVIRAGIPCPGAARGRFEREAEPRFLFPERGLGARALNGVPRPFGDLTNQLDLSRRPDARRLVTGAERGDHPPVFEQPHADKRADLSRPERRPVVGGEPLIAGTSVTTTVSPRLSASRSAPDMAIRTGCRRAAHAARVFAANDVLAAVEFREAHAPCAEVLAK